MHKQDDRAKLEQKIRELEKEGQQKDEQIRRLEATLDQVTPLRRHLKRTVRLRLLWLDRGIAAKLKSQNAFKPQAVSTVPATSSELLERAHKADEQNLARYNQSATDNLSYRLYMGGRNRAAKAARTVLRKVR